MTLLKSPPRRLVVALALGAALLVSTRDVAKLAVEKHFTTDEFQYAHAALLLSNGESPYVDVFEVHLPLIYQGIVLVFPFVGDEPAAVLPMRQIMLALVLLASAAAFAINRRFGPEWALAGPLMLFASLPLT